MNHPQFSSGSSGPNCLPHPKGKENGWVCSALSAEQTQPFSFPLGWGKRLVEIGALAKGKKSGMIHMTSKQGICEALFSFPTHLDTLYCPRKKNA